MTPTLSWLNTHDGVAVLLAPTSDASAKSRFTRRPALTYGAAHVSTWLKSKLPLVFSILAHGMTRLTPQNDGSWPMTLLSMIDSYLPPSTRYGFHTYKPCGAVGTG